MQTHNIIVPCLQCTKKTPGSKEPFHGWRNVRPRAKACLQVVQITAFNFCNHMFKNSRKRYRDRRKRYTYPACSKTNQIVTFDTIHKNKTKKTHLLKCSLVHTGLAPKHHPGPISGQVYHQISFLRFCYGLS